MSEYLLPGPAQDQQARLTVVYAMDRCGWGPVEMIETLDMLALMPGQEDERDKLGCDLSERKEPQCTPSSTGNRRRTSQVTQLPLI